MRLKISLDQLDNDYLSIYKGSKVQNISSVVLVSLCNYVTNFIFKHAQIMCQKSECEINP